jgi:hypothetical protein
MEYNRYKSMNSFYLSDLIGMQPTEKYAKAAKDIAFADALYSAILSVPPSRFSDKEKFLEPVTIFHNEVVLTAKKAGDYTTNDDDNQFYVSLGIFDLDTTSAVATVTKDNKLELTWTERAGKGKFTSIIPSYLVATSAPVLTYEGGVLDIRVNVESRRKNETVFVGKLVESKS